MAIPAYYQKEMARALPGQVSDTSAYNIDGACVVDESIFILCGVAVAVKEVDPMGHKVIENFANGKTAYGVAIRSHFATQGMYGIGGSLNEMMYLAETGINVMTAGRVWIRVSDANLQAQPFGTPVKLDENGHAKADGANVTGWTYTGDVTTFNGVKLAEIQLHQI